MIVIKINTHKSVFKLKVGNLDDTNINPQICLFSIIRPIVHKHRSYNLFLFLKLYKTKNLNSNHISGKCATKCLICGIIQDWLLRLILQK